MLGLPKSKIITAGVDLTGLQYPCLYPTKRIKERGNGLERTSKGDTVYLRKYSFRGEDAFAVMHDGLGCDIGVIPKKDIPKLLKKFGDLDGLSGTIHGWGVEKKKDEDDDHVIKTYDCYIFLERNLWNETK